MSPSDHHLDLAYSQIEQRQLSSTPSRFGLKRLHYRRISNEHHVCSSQKTALSPEEVGGLTHETCSASFRDQDFASERKQ
jgi:hypothetical protein